MKRLVVRVAALGAVVVLGVIAIAQAQRGSNSSPSVADQSPGAAPEPSAEDASEGAVAGVGGGNLLRAEALASPGSNPLRTEPGRGGPDAPGPPKAFPAAGPRKAREDGGPEAAGESGGSSPPEPFGFRLGSSGAPPASGVGPVLQAAGQLPAATPQQTPAPPQTDRSGGGIPSQGPALAQPPAAPSLAYDAADSSAADRDDAFGRQGSPPGEPAPFRADPLAAPASLSSGGTAPSGGAEPPGGGEAASSLAGTGEGTGQPGKPGLEGPQCPQLTIQKFAPQAIQVGTPATFRVTVHNTGSVAAHHVEVRDRVPQGARLIGTTPRASRDAEAELVWRLGTLEPGDESSVEIQLEPIAEGEIGSVATVRFQADASARSVATKPELVLQTSAPEQVLIGEEVTLTIEVSNPGSGVAPGVVLEEHVPAGLQHPAGADLEYEVGDLPPGESRELQLTLLASRPGPVTNVLVGRGEGNLRADQRLRLEVIAPRLELSAAGPKRRYLQREATYQFSVHNPGTAPAQQIELVAYLPSGLKFVSANNAGHYDEADRAVHWQLEELPVGVAGTVELVALPVEPGQQAIRLRGTADKGLTAEAEQPVLVEGIAAIMFEMVDVTDPIEVGGETTYEVRVVNQGSKAATNVRLGLLMPPQMRPAAGEGPTRHVIQGHQVLFDGLARLAPKADTTYRVRAQGLRPGDLRIRAQLTTAEMRTPVTKEESTRVYSDE